MGPRRVKTRGYHARRYDEWCETFDGAVGTYVDLELLKKHLPAGRDVKILDAAGGTGRVALPLARMGYSVTLCDISLDMLSVARQKMRREGLLDRVEISKCDIHRLRFADESFDFVLCWDGAMDAVKKLVRVTKKGGKLSLFAVNRCRAVVDSFLKDPSSALALILSERDYIVDQGESYRAVNEEEARRLLEAEGVRVFDVYAVHGWMSMLNIPGKYVHSRRWDKSFFKQTADMLLRLSEEPSVKGLSKHLVLYGEKTQKNEGVKQAARETNTAKSSTQRSKPKTRPFQHTRVFPNPNAVRQPSREQDQGQDIRNIFPTRCANGVTTTKPPSEPERRKHQFEQIQSLVESERS